MLVFYHERGEYSLGGDFVFRNWDLQPVHSSNFKFAEKYGRFMLGSSALKDYVL